MNADLALLQSGGSVRRQRKLAGQLRFVQRAGASVTALAALIAAGWLWQARQTRVVRELASAKTRLADENATLANEKHDQLVRLRTANGVRLLNEGNTPEALLWFANALPLVTNNSAEEAVHRVRLRCLITTTPVLTGLLRGDDAQNFLLLNPDNSRLLVHAGPIPRGPRTVTLWDLDANKALPGPLNLVTDATFVAISPDGKLCATTHAHGTARLWRTDDGSPLSPALNHALAVNHATFSHDGDRLVTASDDGSARVWRTDSEETAGPALKHSQAGMLAPLSTSGRLLAGIIQSDIWPSVVMGDTWPPPKVGFKPPL
jgi:hypothetical protein